MRLLAPLFSLSLLLGSGLSLAAEVSDDIGRQINAKLQLVNSSIQVVSVEESPIAGLYQVEITNGEMLYSSATGDNFILGAMYQVEDNRFVNLSEQRKQGMRAETLKGLSTDDMVVFSPKGEVKATVYAFTDIDCGYCQKLHSEMDDYNALGIEIRYLAFPRAGIGSNTYNQMVSVWCSDDRQQAMTQAKKGRSVAAKECDNPVAAQYSMGQDFGVNGTPALVLEDGTLMPGYLPAKELGRRLAL
ncbi:MAG: DsbC family protein [Motiliproteus sp.]